MARGAMNLEDQKKALVSKVGVEGEKKAKEILDHYDADVVRLAFKMLPKTQEQKLGKRLENLLAKMNPENAEQVRKSLMEAKVKS